MSNNSDNNDTKSAWIGLATLFGFAGIAMAVNEILESRERVHANLELAKKGKGLGTLWERQEKFEQGVAAFQEAQHKYFEGILRDSTERLAKALKEEVAKINERLETIAAPKGESDTSFRDRN